jgi:predicted alpha/beta superfamily hydrolase
VAFDVAGIPPEFREPWIPVRYAGGRLEFDDRAATATRGQLFLSAERFASRPAKVPGIAPRPVFVFLPGAYHGPDRAKRFPVVYLHDGQNAWDDDSCCFGHGGWNLNRLMDEMTTLPRAILVGIPNSGARMGEYYPGDDVMAMKPTPYVRFLCDVVKPRIDSSFRTLPDRAHTTVMGSSMGGVVSLLAGYVRPDAFGNVVAMSTAFSIPDAKGKSLLDVLRREGRGRFRLYLDSGTAGEWQDGAPQTREFAALAKEKGWRAGVDFLHHEEPGAPHNEGAWRARAWRGLEFALSAGAPASTDSGRRKK